MTSPCRNGYRGARYLTRISIVLTSFTTVVAFLAVWVIYEVASAAITSVQSVQVLNRGGPWRKQRKSLTFLVLREGARHYLLNFLLVRVLILRGRSNIFWVGFKQAPLRDALLIIGTKVHHYTDHTVPNLPSCKIPARLVLNTNLLAEYYKQGGVVSLLFPLPSRFLNTFGISSSLILEPSSLNWSTPTPYRKLLCSILLITLPDISPVQSFRTNDCPLPTQSQGMGSAHVQSGNWPMGYPWRKRGWPTQCHTIQEIRATYFTVDYQWCSWGWSVVEARKIWSEPWRRFIHCQRCFNMTAKTVFNTR